MDKEKIAELRKQHPTELISCYPEESVKYVKEGGQIPMMVFKACNSKSHWKLGLDLIYQIVRSNFLALGPGLVIPVSASEAQIVRETGTIWITNIYKEGEKPQLSISTTEPELP